MLSAFHSPLKPRVAVRADGLRWVDQWSYMVRADPHHWSIGLSTPRE